MKKIISEIRHLIDRLEENIPSENDVAFEQSFSGVEIPDIVNDITDFLIPSLKPYEACFYLHLFRHSVLATGKQYVRVSTYKLQSGVVKSAYADSTSGGKAKGDSAASQATVRAALKGLEEIGAIRKEGEPNRDGTLYRVFLPEEIDACRVQMREKKSQPASHVDIEKEVDYYNIRDNRLAIYERDNYVCQHCGKQLTRFSATLDHLHPVSKGGDNSYVNLVTACRECNSKKTSKTLGDFIADTNPTT